MRFPPIHIRRHREAWGASAATFRGAVGLACFGLGITASPAAHADAVGAGGDPTHVQPDATTHARVAYDAGARAFSEKRFGDAALHFDEAARLAPSAVALLTGALAWERAGQPTRAADDYASAMSAGGLDDKQTKKATDRLNALEAQLGTLRVTGPSGTKVQLDDGGLPAELPALLHTLPGTHVLTVALSDPVATSHSTDRRLLTLAPGQTLAIDVTPPRPAAGAPAWVFAPRVVPTPAPLQPSLSGGPSNPRRFAEVALLGAGVGAELGAAILWWGAAIPARDDYFRTRALNDRSRASSLELWTNVALFGGGALLAAGAVCTLWPLSRAPTTAARSVLRLRVGPGNIQLGGDW